MTTTTTTTTATMNTLSHITHAHATAAAQIGRVADALERVTIDPLAAQMDRVKAEVARIKGEIASVRGQLAAEMADLIGELVAFGVDVADDFSQVESVSETAELPFVPGETCASESEPDGESHAEEDMRERVIRNGLAGLNGACATIRQAIEVEPETPTDDTEESEPGPPQEPGPAPERKRRKRR